MPPTLTATLSVHNQGPYIAAALESILAQTFRDFEFLVTDDGSTDATSRIIDAHATRDRRIVVIRHARRRGVAASLNAMQAQARGEYIARMDGDDLSSPLRFARQIAFMERHRLDLCGAWMRTFGTWRWRTLRYCCDDASIRVAAALVCPFAHGSVMMRRSVIERGARGGGPLHYREGLLPIEDYDLWLRAGPQVAMGNVPETLYFHRLHPRQISHRPPVGGWRVTADLRDGYLAAIGIEASDEERAVHRWIADPGFPRTQDEVRRMEAWLIVLASRLREVSGEEAAYAVPIGQQWLRVAWRAARFGGWARRVYEASPLRRWYAPRATEYAELWLRCARRLDVRPKPKPTLMTEEERRREELPPARTIASAVSDDAVREARRRRA